MDSPLACSQGNLWLIKSVSREKTWCLANTKLIEGQIAASDQYFSYLTYSYIHSIIGCRWQRRKRVLNKPTHLDFFQ